MTEIIKPWLPLLLFLSLSFLASSSLSFGYSNQRRYVIVDQCLALCEQESDVLTYLLCERNCKEQLGPPETEEEEQQQKRKQKEPEREQEEAAETERRRQEEGEREREYEEGRGEHKKGE